ncbi:hypothetical protein [Pseudomonas asgharzadehiana]|jgi:hypothetical protein|uniref:Lipoprotein n=1 Tax=Pseudomonas asgharzadehiana TaxID=2842349 RepID=A0ABX8P6S9_9PSED|nr:hypothetical protein [Pseudomonas asgharzadehiana]QXH69277.1 hypothetical protein KSS96_10260 [Pseudomonas asgharzadehiana]
MNRQVLGVLFALGITGLFGCVGRPVDSFTLEVDLPANFKLKTAANYRPATGETCTLPQRRGKRPERKVFFTDYTPVAHRLSYQLPLTETVNGCPLVLRGVEFDVYAKWGSRDSDLDGDLGSIAILDRSDIHSSEMPDSGVQQLPGQCQWLFRTVGPKQAIIKLLKCNSLDALGQLQKTPIGGLAQRDQLAGKTLRMALRVIDEEAPAIDDNWVAVPDGWKRCKGKSFEDPYAFCNGNVTDFKPIKMPDGRTCEVYPSCK